MSIISCFNETSFFALITLMYLTSMESECPVISENIYKIKHEKIWSRITGKASIKLKDELGKTDSLSLFVEKFCPSRFE